ncbi:MAG: LysR substrate-binding domain-containing protein [Burkholderiaceae bacterium]
MAPPATPCSRSGTPRWTTCAPTASFFANPAQEPARPWSSFWTSRAWSHEVVMEMGSNETIKQAVMAGMGISFLAAFHWAGASPRPDLHGAGRRRTSIVRAWNVVHTLSKLLSPAAESFRYYMLERAEQHLAQTYGRFLDLQSPPASLPATPDQP